MPTISVDNRNDYFNEISILCNNFQSIDNFSKFIWLFTHENLNLYKYFGKYFFKNLEIREVQRDYYTNLL